MDEQEADKFLGDVLPKYERLTRVVSALIENILTQERIEFLSVTARTKSQESAIEKFRRKSYEDIPKQMTDLSGIRVITYLDSQVRHISEIIRKSFSVNYKHTYDRSQILSDDRVGYRSVHFVCTLGTSRKNIIEYKDLCDLHFEIQIRTVLQHAWAELAHDRSYKFSGTLPPHIQRRLNLYAGMLEIADTAFDEIARSVDDYENRLRADSNERLREEGLNSASLKEFLQRLSKNRSIPNLELGKLEGMAIEDLTHYGISRIGDLEILITDNFIENLKKSSFLPSGVAFLRRVLLYSDFDRVIQNAHTWSVMTVETRDFLEKKYGKERIRNSLKEHSIPVRRYKTIPPQPAQGSDITVPPQKHNESPE